MTEGKKSHNLVCISATSRPGNFTAKALAVVTDELSVGNASPLVFDARDLRLSFPGQSPTDDAERLRAAIGNATGVVIATPEYHGTFSAVTKLIIENLGFPSVLAGKPVALVGVAAGRIGAIKSLEHLRGVCAHVGALVLPGAISIAGVNRAFDADGRCTDPAAETALRGLANSLLAFIENYVCPKFALEAIAREEGEPWISSV